MTEPVTDTRDDYHAQKVRDRVAAGVAWLQGEFGADWWLGIDRGRLDIESSSDCILGQLYGDYLKAPVVARFQERWKALPPNSPKYDETILEALNWLIAHGFSGEGIAPVADLPLSRRWHEVLDDLYGEPYHREE